MMFSLNTWWSLITFGCIGIYSVRARAVASQDVFVDEEWLINDQYNKSESERFLRGKFIVGIPKQHSCIQKSFSVPGGRLICAKSPPSVMCYAQCMNEHILTTGYIDNIETPKNKLNDFGVYWCDPKNQGYWTDVDGVKLSMPGPWCEKKTEVDTV